MIGWLVGLLAPRIGEKAAKPAAFGLIAMAVILILWGGKCAYDSSIIKAHDQEQALEIERNSSASNTVAADERFNDTNRLATEKREAQEAIDNAKAEGRDPRAAYYHCVELQQRARAAGDPAPSC